MFAAPRRSLVCICLVAFFSVPGFSVPGIASDQPETHGQTPDQTADHTFESRARSILRAHCWHCHGEEPEIQGGLDLRLVRFIQTGGESGPAIVAGESSASLLIEKVVSGEMPPSGKGLSDAELDALKSWIDAGAKTARPEPETFDPDSPWTIEEQNHWAFKPVTRPAIPATQDPAAIRNPIDAFILAKLEDNGLTLSPPADRLTLLRRLTIDLHGLPPNPAQIEEFLADTSPDAYENLVERLLASPAYGERWARHWLDTAGYADSDGYTQDDRPRAWVYRYRDYVIQSFNQDKPFDQFVIEQLAGDELVTPPYVDLDDAAAEKLVATGFLRLAPDGTGQGEDDPMLTRNEMVAETIKVATSTLLGLTVGCAQCHNHRYDPISQADYFRIRALFEPALDAKQWRDRPARLISTWNAAEREQAARVDAQLAEIEGKRVAELDEIVTEVFHKEVAKLPEELQEIARTARDTAADERTAEHLAVLKEYPSLNVDRGSVYLYEPARMAEFNKKYETLVAETRQQRPAESYIDALTEIPGQIPQTFLHFRGDHNQPREPVDPGDLSVLPSRATVPGDDPELSTSGRRLAYARHLTNGNHPLVGRVFVNRVWMHHFGRGLVATPGDFGALGETPSHPELLDWLADEFVRTGWGIKQLHRQIVCSDTYRQRSTRTPELESIDPENRLLGRMNLRRLEAEAIRDAMIAATGLSDTTMFGAPEVVNPDEVGQIIIGTAARDGNGILVAPFVDGPQQYRRSIYVQARRSQPLGLMEPFDLPNLSPNCDRRSVSTVAPQALLMMNNRQTVLMAEHFARRLVKEHPNDPTGQAGLGWLLAFGGTPSSEQLQQAVDLITTRRAAIEEANQATSEEAKPSALDGEVESVALYCQALFSSNRFLYVD
jgi:mono/diheme cytochrome c family protein